MKKKDRKVNGINESIERRGNRNFFQYFITFGICLCVLMFIFGVAVYFLKSCQIANSVNNALQKKSIEPTDIEWIKEVPAYYRDTSNFNMMQLIYMLISTILSGSMVAFVFRQFENISSKEKNVNATLSKINDIAGDIEEKKLHINKTVIDITNQEKYIVGYYEEISKVSKRWDEYEIERLVYIILVNSSMLYSLLSTSENSQKLTLPISMLRKYLPEVKKQIIELINKQTVSHEKNKQIKNAISSVIDQLIPVQKEFRALSDNGSTKEENMQNAAIFTPVDGFLFSCNEYIEILEKYDIGTDE